jgi:hypothetical protein
MPRASDPRSHEVGRDWVLPRDEVEAYRKLRLGFAAALGGSKKR